MPLRDRVRRALNRPVVRRTNRKGVKLEYFHRNEVPRSKFRGPFDPEHQKSLEQWSFTAAMAPRPRSPDLSLSPCTSIPQSNPSLTRPIPSDPPQQQPQQQNHVNHNVDDNEGIAPDQTDVMDSKLFYPGLLSPCIQSSPPQDVGISLTTAFWCLIAAPTVTQIEDAHGRGRQAPDGGSQSSTMVDPDSYNGSVMTLLPDSHRPLSSSNSHNVNCNKKESVRYTSPAIRSASPLPKAKAGSYMPFSPEDLTRALNAVQIY